MSSSRLLIFQAFTTWKEIGVGHRFVHKGGSSTSRNLTILCPLRVKVTTIISHPMREGSRDDGCVTLQPHNQI